ncbi:hypothetical protein M426DRAFT_317542 [Hypoxylon sp. CI-4A]|nr:hypothetical protein M426DRAFT_317542 [Hypoxylon sp. CI-4A]
MARLRAALPTLALIATAFATQNLTTYIPGCAQSCIEASISNNSQCAGPEDSQCLCTNERQIGYGSLSCAQQACSSNSTEDLVGQLRSGYSSFCNDAGIQDSSGGSGPASGWPSGWGGSSQTSTAATSAPTSTASSTSVPTAAADSTSLSRGAIAGIAVGGGIALIAITGGLFLLAFRLGKGFSGRKKDEGPGQQEQAGEEDTNKRDDQEKAGVKPQLEGMPVSELPTEYTLSGFDPVKELPTREKPVELSAEPLPRGINNGSPVLPQSWR